jgi:hypothetical protein
MCRAPAVLEYAQAEGGYVAHDKVPMLSILPDGNVGENGSFEAGEFWMSHVVIHACGKEAKEEEAKERGKSKPKKTVIAKANIKLKSAGPVMLHLHLDKAGKKVLAQMKRKHTRPHVTVRLQFKR